MCTKWAPNAITQCSQWKFKTEKWNWLETQFVSLFAFEIKNTSSIKKDKSGFVFFFYRVEIPSLRRGIIK